MERCLLPQGMAARCLLDTKLGGGYQGELSEANAGMA